MAGQQTTLRRSRSIASIILIAIGMIILYQNLGGEIVRLGHILGDNGSEMLLASDPVFHAIAQIQQEYCTAHERFLTSFLNHLLVLFAAILLMLVGMALPGNRFVGIFNEKIENVSIRRPVVRR